MDSSAGLFVSMIFGAFGAGYLLYAKTQHNWKALVAGLALCIFPYFVSNIWLMILVGAVISAAPIVFRD